MFAAALTAFAATLAAFATAALAAVSDATATALSLVLVAFGSTLFPVRLLPLGIDKLRGRETSGSIIGGPFAPRARRRERRGGLGPQRPAGDGMTKLKSGISIA